MHLQTEFKRPSVAKVAQLKGEGKWQDAGDCSGNEDGSLKEHLEGYYNGRCTSASLTPPGNFREDASDEDNPFVPLSAKEMGAIAYRGNVLHMTKWNGEYATYKVPRGYLTVQELYDLCNRHLGKDVPRRHRAGCLNLDHSFYEGIAPLATHDEEGRSVPWDERVYAFRWGS